MVIDLLVRLSQKDKLRTLLENPKFPVGRSLKALSKSIGEPEDRTIKLLKSLGAREIVFTRDRLWTLKKK